MFYASIRLYNCRTFWRFSYLNRPQLSPACKYDAAMCVVKHFVFTDDPVARVVDTVVGRAIVMVIFLSAAAFKRLLEQRPWAINPIFVIIEKTKFAVVYSCRFFAATFKLWGENPHYLCRYLKVFNCHWFCERDEVWETVNCSPVTRNFQYIIGHLLGKGQLQMNISLKQLKYFCIFQKILWL